MRGFDVSKFRKAVTKNIDGISSGFHDPKTWISTGNHALNYLICGNFQHGIPLGKVTIVAGEPGSGKSYIASANIIKHAQEKGIHCILLDSENALDTPWLAALGVDTDPSMLSKYNVSMIDDVAKLLSDFMKTYKAEEADNEPEERLKVLFVVDSLGMLLTPTDINQFEKGEMKGDMGRAAKQLKALVKNMVVQLGEWEIGMVCTNHTYQSQDMFNPDDKITGGSGPIFAASQVIAIKKLKLKEDEKGNKITDVTGIRAKVKVVKSRFSKPFEDVEIKIPYETGMDPYSGLFDLFVKKGVIVKPSGNKYVYIDLETKEHKYFEKEWKRNENGILDIIMKEWDEEVLQAINAVSKEEDDV